MFFSGTEEKWHFPCGPWLGKSDSGGNGENGEDVELDLFEGEKTEVTPHVGSSSEPMCKFSGVWLCTCMTVLLK